MSFDRELAKSVALQVQSTQEDEHGLAECFAEICSFLWVYPDQFSWRATAQQPKLEDQHGLMLLAKKYFSAYRKSDFPTMPGTIPDQIVGIVMTEAYGYTTQEYDHIKIDHQRAMGAENCVGALLERYLDSVLRADGWCWCCGSFTRAIDFVKRDTDNTWIQLQVKNRSNSENSSSSAIRRGTLIKKWFRSYAHSNRTNWASFPIPVVNHGPNEDGFVEFVKTYLNTHRNSGSR